jgi:hypothetical protein
LIYVWQGIPQTLDSATTVTTLEGAKQQIVMRPVASLESIKHLGTDGGGFFGVNAAHPYENLTPLTNFIHMICMLLIPGALTYVSGTMLMRRRQGWAFFAAFLAMFIVFLVVVYGFESAGNPLLTGAGADQHNTATQLGGNLEGKEVRFGVPSQFPTSLRKSSGPQIAASRERKCPIPSSSATAVTVMPSGSGANRSGDNSCRSRIIRDSSAPTLNPRFCNLVSKSGGSSWL